MSDFKEQFSEEELAAACVPDFEPCSEELAITKMLCGKLKEQDCLTQGERESVAYRLAEIMVHAKNIYTDILPRLAECEAIAKAAEADEAESTEDEECGCGSDDCDHCADEEDSRPIPEDPPIFNELTGARMALIQMRDLINDFDDAFMNAMAAQREADGSKERLPEAEDFDFEE